MEKLKKDILKEFGNRIKQYRISSNMTQAELAEYSGLSLSTLTRMENGDDTKWSAIIKILTVFDLADNIDILIPRQTLDYKALFEEKPQRKRASRKDANKNNNNDWVWGEDREE